MTAPVGRRLSGLQKDVLALYRALIRSASRKSDPVVKQNLVNVGKYTSLFSASTLLKVLSFCAVKMQFREDARSVKKNDYQSIEHMLRHGYKQKKVLEMPGFTKASIVIKERVIDEEVI